MREGRGKAHYAPTRTMAEPGLSVDLSEDPRAAPEPPGGAQPHTHIRTHALVADITFIFYISVWENSKVKKFPLLLGQFL